MAYKSQSNLSRLMRKLGRSKSPAKAAAARKNGKLGGRPPRTKAERVAARKAKRALAAKFGALNERKHKGALHRLNRRKTSATQP